MTLWSFIDTGDGWGDDTHAAVWALSQTPGQDVTRYSQYHNSGAGQGDDVADAVTNPSGDKLVYCITPIGAGSSQLKYCPFPLVPGVPGDPSSVPGSSTLDTNPSTLVVSMHPYWSPADDDLVVYRTMDDSPNECKIKTVQPSVGAGSISTLITVSRASGNINFPRLNFDGSRIAYGLGNNLRVMDANGANDQQIVANIGAEWQGGLDYAWSPVADELVYSKTNGEYRLIQGDGSGDTLLYTDTDTPLWGLTLYPWSPDGTTIYFFKNDQGSDPKYSLWTIDAGGGGAAQVSPLRTTYGGNNDQLAYVFGNRVYWHIFDSGTGADYGQIVSCALDGSGLRVEIQFPLQTDPAPLDPERFVSGFYYWLNQPR